MNPALEQRLRLWIEALPPDDVLLVSAVAEARLDRMRSTIEQADRATQLFAKPKKGRRLFDRPTP